MSQQPDALRLADSWDSAISTRRHVAIGCEMADELRRLHAENEELRIQASSQIQALSLAEATFRKYWHHHKQKGDDVNAQANLDLAEQMAAA